MEIDTHRPDTKGKTGKTLTSRTGTADKTGYRGRYRQHRQENDALPTLRQTERTEGKREEKHTEATGTAHAVIERGQVARSIDTIKPSDAKEWALRMKDKGFSYNTINNHKRSLKASFYIAIQDDCVRKNPFDFKLSEVLENDTKEEVALTEEQEQALLSFIKTDNVYHKYYDDVLILLKTGLRISELCGLTIMDVDFIHEVVVIDHQLLKSKEQGYYIETPKTKSGTRQVPLSKETIQAFQRVMKKRPKTEPFVIDGQSNFLFVNPKGKPKVAIDYTMLFVRMVKKYNKHHKDNPLPHITPHTLRHTFCTRLASKNMNPKDLQYIMGHSNISITMNWYAHASIDTAKSEVQRLIA